jgi:hypothetical protein
MFESEVHRGVGFRAESIIKMQWMIFIELLSNLLSEFYHQICEILTRDAEAIGFKGVVSSLFESKSKIHCS